MEQEKRGRDMRAEELDRFWDIDSLLPPKRPVPKSLHTDTVEIQLDEQTMPAGGTVSSDIPISPPVGRCESPELPVRHPGHAEPSVGRSFQPSGTVGKSAGWSISTPTDNGQLPEASLSHPVHCSSSEESAEPALAEIASTEPIAGQTVVHSVSASEEEPIIHRYVDPLAAQKLANAPKPEEEYVPQSALIHKVRIFRWKSNYQYYENFALTAEKLQKMHGQPCKPVPFFSYAPQYSQMNRSQMNWYLWLRDCVNRGEYPDTDYSYVLLLIYEVINLAGKPEPAVGQNLLCNLWKYYRDRFHQLDSNLPEWICDYSLLYHLPPPDGLDAEQLAQIMRHCVLKEFYVSGNPDDGYLRALLTFCTNYDYHKSKFCTPENAALFDSTIADVLRLVTEYLSESGKLFATSGMDDCRMTRDAFSAALCSYRIKRKIEVSYCSFSRSHELRFLVTDVIKYTENQLRAHLGIRSRLSVYALPTVIRQKIDEWFEAHMEARAPEKKPTEPKRAAYESLYDLPDQTLSFANAAEIERASWDTTQKLVEAFEEAEAGTETSGMQESEPPVPVPSASETEPEPAEETLGALLRPFRKFLNAAMEQDSAAQEREAKAMGSLPDALAERINEIAADAMGDVLLEDLGGYYGVIEDYRSLSDEWA